MALFHTALHNYATCNWFAFACLSLPILEAGLRAMFVQANPGEHSLGRARPDHYFVTLDGYGQRDKHQLLLEPTARCYAPPFK